MSGNRISVKTLDLNLPFEEISQQLNSIVVNEFKSIEKYMKNISYRLKDKTT